MNTDTPVLPEVQAPPDMVWVGLSRFGMRCFRSMPGRYVGTYHPAGSQGQAGGV